MNAITIREGLETSQPTIAEAVDAFLDDVLLERRRGTHATYGSLLQPLRRQHGERPLFELTPAVMRQLLTDKLRAGKASSAATYRGCLGAFAKWCTEQYALAQSPMAGVPTPRPGGRVHRFLDKDELGQLWSAAQGSRPKWRSENMLIVLLLLEGLRASELCELRWRDLRPDGTLHLVFTKGDHPRAVALNDATRELLDARPRTGPKIFRFTRNTLYVRVKMLGARAGLPGIKPHLLRHTFASWWMIEVGDGLMLQQLGGWKSDRMIRDVYAQSALEQVALKRSRGADLSGRLLPQLEALALNVRAARECQEQLTSEVAAIVDETRTGVHRPAAGE